MMYKPPPALSALEAVFVSCRCHLSVGHIASLLALCFFLFEVGDKSICLIGHCKVKQHNGYGA